jgi:coproporphyrinogen III oxidase
MLVVRRRVALLALAAVLAIPAALAAGPGDDLDQLTPEQAEVARDMLDFMAATETRFWARVDALNGMKPGKAAVETLVMDPPKNGHYEVRVHRGKVVEKAGIMTVNTQLEKPPFVIGGRWNRFIEVAVHPKTPLLGMLHATFSVQVSSKGEGNIGATMDMMQAAQPPEDLALFDERVTAVFAKYGMDREKYRGKGCAQKREGPWKYYRPGTCTGVSMYGPDMLADEKHFALVSELYSTVVDTYFDLLDKHKRQRYGATELAAQDAMRRGWLEDQLFWDVLAKNFVPYEAWAAVNAPPVVKF